MKITLFIIAILSLGIMWNDTTPMKSTVINLPQLDIEQPVRAYDSTVGGHIGIIEENKR